MATRGPKKKELDKNEFEGLCRLQCTEAEICGWFDIDHKTLQRWCKDTYDKNYSQVYGEKAQAGRISLRRAQFRLAERSAAMAIFLGKQYLGQSDNPNGFDDENLKKVRDALAGVHSAIE
jgi:hypothetical protein